MPWQWYSAGNAISPSFTPFNQVLVRSFELLIDTANVHRDHNFPNRPLQNYVTGLRQKVTDGDVVVAFDSADAGTLKKVIYFQRARQKFGNPDGIIPAGEEAWVVTYGFDQTDENVFPGNADRTTCRAHTSTHLTPVLMKFTNHFRLNYLYTVEFSDPNNETEANAIRRKIGRLQRYSNGDQWVADLAQTKRVVGSRNYHQYWGQPIGGGQYEFYVNQISRV